MPHRLVVHWRLDNGNLACRYGHAGSPASDRRRFHAAEPKCKWCAKRLRLTEEAEQRIAERKAERRKPK